LRRDAHDVVAVIAEIAGKRAAQFGRAPVIGDVDLVIALLGYDASAIFGRPSSSNREAAIAIAPRAPPLLPPPRLRRSVLGLS